MTDSQLTLRIGSDSTKLQAGLRQSSAAIDSFGSKAKASIGRLGTAFKGAADRMLTPFNSLVLGGGLGMAIKNVGDLSESLMYYGFAAKKSDADTKVFRASLHRMAKETGVDVTEILNGVSKIGEITGQFDFAEEMGETIAKASKASGASVEDLANVASSLRVTMGLTSDEVAKFFNSLMVQGDQGSFVLRSFATEGKALLAATSTHGIKNANQFASFGAYLQVMNSQIKSEAELTTSVSALFSELTLKAKDLNKIGVHVFDKNREFNDFDAIIRQLMDKTNGDLQKLGKIFGASSIKALQPIITEYKNKWKTLDAITKSGQEGMTNTDVLDKRAAEASDAFVGSMGKIKAVAMEFADMNLTGPVEQLTSALNYLSNHQGIVTAGFKAMAAAAALLVSVKVVEFGKSVAGLAKDLRGIWSRKNGGNAAMPSADAAGLVQKVFVVNMPGTMPGVPGAPGTTTPVGNNAPATDISRSATQVVGTTREMGRFGTAVASARGGLNKLGNTLAGGTVLMAATNWAVGQIEQFGSAFMQWRETVNDVEKNSENYLREGEKAFEDRYGAKAGFYNKKLNDTMLAIQKEENSFLPSQKKIDALYAEQNRYRELMKNSIKNRDDSKTVSVEDYMKNLTVAPNIVINMSPDGRFNATSDGGKPANIKAQKKNTPFVG